MSTVGGEQQLRRGTGRSSSRVAGGEEQQPRHRRGGAAAASPRGEEHRPSEALCVSFSPLILLQSVRTLPAAAKFRVRARGAIISARSPASARLARLHDD